MKMSQNNNPMDQLLADMCKHVANLQEKLNVANSAVNKGQCINEKITQMKEVFFNFSFPLMNKIIFKYQEKVNSLNSCWRTKNRSQLVSNLQQENRQIIALEEENRQLKFAVKELEDGMHLIMNDYRKVLSGFMRVENLDEAASSKSNNVCCYLTSIVFLDLFCWY